jgi:hypothetical protein
LPISVCEVESSEISSVIGTESSIIQSSDKSINNIESNKEPVSNIYEENAKDFSSDIKRLVY